MKIKSAILTVTVLWTSISLAAAPPPNLMASATCPAIGEEFSSLIAKLDDIKASVREGANCSNVALKVRDLEDLLVSDREKIKQIIDAGRTAPLTAEQTDTVRNYAEQVTVKVAALYDLFTGNNECFKDDNKESRMASLAGFVGEASRLIGTLSGPWGTPIAMAGHVAAGFITGMDKVLKSRAGYDFSKPASWTNYVQNLCTFHSYREQIDHLLDPQTRIAQLKGIKSTLELNIQKMSTTCGDCELVEPMATYMAYNLGIRNWVNKELLRVEKESSSFWADVSGRHLLSQARNDLQQFLVDREGPRFIGYQTGITASYLKHMHFQSSGEGRDLYNQIYRANPQAVTANLSYYFSGFMEFFRALVVQPILWEKLADNAETEDLKYLWQSYRDRNLSRFRSTEASMQVAQGFCQFFRQAGLYTPQIRGACTAPQARSTAAALAGLADELTVAKVIPSGRINLSVFDPGASGRRGPRTPLESLDTMVRQLAP